MTTENQQIIDATQDAVLNVADSVGTVLETTTHEIGEHNEALLQSAEFWVAVSFVLVVVALFIPIKRIARHMLKRRANLIGKRIEDASNLKAEAQRLLAEYEVKYRGAGQEAQEILMHAERDVNLMRKERLAKLESDIQAKEREAKERIRASQDNATAMVAKVAAKRTVNAVKAILNDNLNDKMQSKLIDNSIKNLAESDF